MYYQKPIIHSIKTFAYLSGNLLVDFTRSSFTIRFWIQVYQTISSKILQRINLLGLFIEPWNILYWQHPGSNSISNFTITTRVQFKFNNKYIFYKKEFSNYNNLMVYFGIIDRICCEKIDNGVWKLFSYVHSFFVKSSKKALSLSFNRSLRKIFLRTI